MLMAGDFERASCAKRLSTQTSRIVLLLRCRFFDQTRQHFQDLEEAVRFAAHPTDFV